MNEDRCTCPQPSTCSYCSRMYPCRCEHCPHRAVRPVTGPDGDNPITDDQIRELSHAARSRMSRNDAEIGDDEIERAAFIAFDRRFANRRRINARESLAAAYNARHAGKEAP